MKKAFSVVGVIVAVVALVVGISWGGYALYATFQPKYVHVQYQTFKQSQQYNEGQVQQIEAYREQYATASSKAARQSICSIVNEQYAAYNPSNLTPAQAAFLSSCSSNF